MCLEKLYEATDNQTPLAPEVQKHLQFCDSCSQAYDEIIAIDDSLSSDALLPAPSSLHIKVMEEIASLEPHTQTNDSSLYGKFWLLVYGTGILACLLLLPSYGGMEMFTLPNMDLPTMNIEYISFFSSLTIPSFVTTASDSLSLFVSGLNSVTGPLFDSLPSSSLSTGTSALVAVTVLLINLLLAGQLQLSSQNRKDGLHAIL